MPNRIIKESTFTSDKIAKLSDFEFRLWVGLITQADDAGRGDARPAIIKGRVFALRDRTSLRDIQNALSALAAHGCVSLYTVGGRPYYEFPHWAAHQRVRNAVTKFPGSDESDDSPQLAATRGDSPQLAARIQSNPIQSESESEGESKARARMTPPTLEEVEAYCRERCSPVDPRKFWEYFEVGGWKDNKGQPVRNWKQKLLTWEKYDKPTQQGAARAEADPQYAQKLDAMRRHNAALHSDEADDAGLKYLHKKLCGEAGE